MRFAATCAIAMLCPLLHAAGSVTSRTVALTGVDDQYGPGLGAEVTFRSIASASRIPTLANDSRLAFAATIQGPGVSADNDSGVWIGGDAPPTLLVREGDAAPDFAPPVRLGEIHTATINDTGRVVFHARLLGLEPEGATIRGYFSIREGNRRLIARDGQTLTTRDAQSFTIARVLEPTFGGPDRVYFRAALGPTPGAGSNDWAVFEWTEKGSRLLARRFVPAPEMGAGIAFASADGAPVATSPTDSGVFDAEVGPAGAAPTTGVLYERVDDELIPRVAGGPAPGLSGVTFQPGAPVVSNAGDVAFHAVLQGPSIAAGDANAIFAHRDAVLSLIARGGQPAQPSSHVFSGFPLFAINDQGAVVFVAETRVPPSTSSAPTGLWRWNEPSLQAIALKGQPAPGTAPASTFDRFNYAYLNNQNVITFEALARTPANALLPGVWAIDPTGKLLPVANAGAPIELRPGDVRTPTFGVFASGGPVRRPLNNSNQMLYWCSFPDAQSALRIASVPPGCPADFNADAMTDGRDLSILLAGFGGNVTPGSGADANRDGIIDGRDLSVLLAAFGCAG